MNYIFKRSLFAVLIVFMMTLIHFSCNTPVQMEKDITLTNPKIVLSKGACYGECPVYNLTIYNTGLMKYNGIRFTPMQGKYEKQLTENEYIELVKAFNAAKIWKLEDNYDMNIADLATTTLSYSDKDKIKTIKSKSGFPQPVDGLEKQLIQLINQDGWVQTDAPLEQLALKNEVLIKNELIIKGNEQMILVRWLREYADYDMKIVRRLGPESPLWLVTFNEEKIDPDDLLKKVKGDPNIETVEFNKKVSNRE